MEQWYQDARQYLKQYRFYHGIVEQVVNDWKGAEKPRRLQQMELYCQRVTNAIDSIRDERQADILRNEFVVADGNQRVAYELLGLSKTQYYVIRKQAMREWWQLISRHG